MMHLKGRVSIEQIGEQFKGVLILMDRAYEGDKTRKLCYVLEHESVVLPKKNRINPWKYDKELYKQRNVIERLFRWLNSVNKL